MIALAVIGGIVAALGAWVISTSALLCAFTRQWPLFVFPFDQWLVAVCWFKAVGWLMKGAIVGSALIPSLVLSLIVTAIIVQLRRVEKRPALYGHTGWADRNESRRAGLDVDQRKIF